MRPPVFNEDLVSVVHELQKGRKRRTFFQFVGNLSKYIGLKYGPVEGNSKVYMYNKGKAETQWTILINEGYNHVKQLTKEQYLETSVR